MGHIVASIYILLLLPTGDLGDRFGAWSSDGCREVMREGNRRVCECSQLAHFGILFVNLTKLDRVSASITYYLLGFKSKGTDFCRGCFGSLHHHIHWLDHLSTMPDGVSHLLHFSKVILP